MTSPRSALVTGATGFIGSALARALVAEGLRVYCLVRRSSPRRPRLESTPGIVLVDVDSARPNAVRQALGAISAEAVFHLASYGTDPTDRDPEAMIEGNVSLLTSVLLATANWPLRCFVHAGSCAEYGAGAPGAALTEAAPLCPMSLYGAAKAAAEIYGGMLAGHLGVPFVTLRLFGVFGIGEAAHRLIPYLIERLGRDKPVDLTPGEQVRDLLYVEDVIDAFLAAMRPNGVPSGTAYNVCSGCPVRVREVAETVAELMGRSRRLLGWGARAYRPDEPMWLLGDNTSFATATGWRPRVTLVEGIHRMISATAPAGPSAKPGMHGRV